MIRKLHTRGGCRERFYHEKNADACNTLANEVIRPPTSHPYSAYKSKKSQSQIRLKYMPNYAIDFSNSSALKELNFNAEICHQMEKLPQHFKLLINQIRIFMKNKVSERCLEFDELIKSLSKALNQVIKERDNFEKDLLGER